MLRTVLLLVCFLPLAALARDWQVDPGKSTLGFEASYQGDAFLGRFKRFSADIRYDASELAQSKFDVRIDLASADTESSERDETLQGDDFFATARFPQAHFVTESFRRGADGAVEALGTLSIRDRSRPVTLAVDFKEQGERATLDVRTRLKRADFGLGEASDWDEIGAEVAVTAHLELTAR